MPGFFVFLQYGLCIDDQSGTLQALPHRYHPLQSWEKAAESIGN